MTHTDTIEIATCDNALCSMPFDEREGWSGLCPSCLALLDEHAAYGHEASHEGCIACHRAPLRTPVGQRAA